MGYSGTARTGEDVIKEARSVREVDVLSDAGSATKRLERVKTYRLDHDILGTRSEATTCQS